jgi:hypothetical protein
MLTVKQNVEKAKKEIEKLEADEAAEANGVNGKEDKVVAETTSELKKSSLDDKKDGEKATA